MLKPWPHSFSAKADQRVCGAIYAREGAVVSPWRLLEGDAAQCSFVRMIASERAPIKMGLTAQVASSDVCDVGGGRGSA